MPANPYQASRAYATTGLETTVADASPEELILMLHNGVLEALHRARLAMLQGTTNVKGESISKALSILTEGLMPALDPARGGEIAANLGALYEYMITRLMMANLQNSTEHLDEVANLVRELKGAWEQLVASRPAPVALPAAAVALPGVGPSLSLGAA